MNKNLLQICRQWEKDFKGDLLENTEEILSEHGNIKNYINYLIAECFPIWIDESIVDAPENTSLYIDYQNRFKSVLVEL